MDDDDDLANAIREEWNRFADAVKPPATCLYCDAHHVVCNGFRVRTASVARAGRVVHVTGIRCRRVRCQSCRHSWTMRPRGLHPHKHYQPSIVADALGQRLWDPAGTQAAVAARVGASRRTIARWVKWVAGIADPARLQQQIAASSGAPVLTPLRPVTAAVRKSRSPIRRGLLATAARVLGLLEALGAALGEEPPGLEAVLRRFVGDRVGVAVYRDPAIPELARRLATAP